MILKLIAASVSAFALTAILGYFVIPFLRKLKFGQSIRECGPEEHMKKSGTPTMGGLIMIPAIIIPVLLFTSSDRFVIIAMFLFLAHAIIGFVDDYIKVVLKRNLGLNAKQKLVAQFLIAAIYILSVSFDERATSVLIPFSNTYFDLGYFYYVLVVLLLIGATNAVNLTDGLDGLASGATVPVAVVYVLIALMLYLPSLSIFAACIAGSCLGFLIFNYKPAKIFMGDTGSLALGGAIAALALLTKTELFLVIIGGLYVVEALSVIIQVISFKTRGKRVFRMSPLHHHYELGGWKETKVVKYFWLLSSIFAVLGLTIWLYTVLAKVIYF